MSKATWFRGVVVTAGLAGAAVVFAWDGDRPPVVVESPVQSTAVNGVALDDTVAGIVGAVCCKGIFACGPVGPGGCPPDTEPMACPCPIMKEAGNGPGEATLGLDAGE